MSFNGLIKLFIDETTTKFAKRKIVLGIFALFLLLRNIHSGSNMSRQRYFLKKWAKCSKRTITVSVIIRHQNL